jgi:hypothetical protein
MKSWQEKIEKFKQSSKSQNLEQLVELTKQYYVKRRLEQLADGLSKWVQHRMFYLKLKTL